MTLHYWWQLGLDVPFWGCLGGDVFFLRAACTDPSNSSFSFPGHRLPLLPAARAPSPPSSRHPEAPGVSQHHSLPLSPGRLASLLPRLQVSHVSTLSPLPWQSALHWASLTPSPSSGRAQGQGQRWDPADRGLAGVKQGRGGQGKGVQRPTSRWVLSQEPHR